MQKQNMDEKAYVEGRPPAQLLIRNEANLSHDNGRGSQSPDLPLTPTSPTQPLHTSDERKLEKQYPNGLVLYLTLFALCLAIFCVALDTTIIATAIPRITDEFHALQNVGWYGSAYFLTTCSFQLPFGKVFKHFTPKWVFLFSLLLFEIGSLLCAISPSSVVLILGRAIAGVGAAGISCGALLIIAQSSPIEKRPMYFSLLGAMYGIASVLGPLIGGAFTDRATWRWCFGINLPLGSVTAAIILYYLRSTPAASPFERQDVWEVFCSLDPLGFILFVPGIICLLLALQWGGTAYAWDSSRIIILLVIFGVSTVAFIIEQIYRDEKATIPPRIARQRTVWSASVFTLTQCGTYYLLIYFMPIYFQAIKASTALQSGVLTIPIVLCNALGSLLSGYLTTRFGHYMPFILAGVVVSCTAVALLATQLTPDTPTAATAGYQILYGLGSGLGFQLPQVAVQAALPLADVQTGISINMFFLNFGGAVFVSVGNHVLDTRLLSYLTSIESEGGVKIDPHAIIQAGALTFRNLVSKQALPAVVTAYNSALRDTFRVALILACLSMIGALFMEWRNVKRGTQTEEAKDDNAQSASRDPGLIGS